MPFRSSLKGCVEAAIGRFRHGHSTFIIITLAAGGKYYTLFHQSEYEARLINKPFATDRIVLACTPGELASIIGTAQMNLALTEN